MNGLVHNAWSKANSTSTSPLLIVVLLLLSNFPTSCLLQRTTLHFFSSHIGQSVGNKGEIIPEFSLEITQFDFTKRGGRDEAWTKSLS